MAKGFYLYDFKDVMGTEEEELLARYDHLLEEPYFEKWVNKKIRKFMEKEVNDITDAFHNDSEEELYKRFEIVAEDPDTGEIWVTLKLFRINELTKMFGTEESMFDEEGNVKQLTEEEKKELEERVKQDLES